MYVDHHVYNMQMIHIMHTYVYVHTYTFMIYTMDNNTCIQYHAFMFMLFAYTDIA